jgi:peptidoglycan/LPS O-acetylase OafA/YrhL
MSRAHTANQAARAVGENGQPPPDGNSTTPQIAHRISANTSFKPRPLSPLASAHLDLIRGLAAWVVMWDHSRSLFFVSYEQLEARSSIFKFLYFITGFGHESVMVFFVLSGFLISSSVLGKKSSGAWKWREYGIDRLSRLWVVLIPGLLLGLLWDEAGSHFFANTGLYTRLLEGFGVIAQNRIGVGAFLGNLFFLQGILSPQFGSNVPLWSLANEFWYYVLFPLGLIGWISWRRKALRTFGISLALFVMVAVFVGRSIFESFSIWLMGTVLVVAYSKFGICRRTWATAYFVASALLLCVWLTIERTGHLNDLRGDIVMGILFTFFLFGVLQMDFGAQSPVYERLAQWLAGFSYSLYVLHFPLLVFARAKIVPGAKWQPDALRIGYWGIIGLVVLAYSWLISIFTERRTKAVRNWMRRIVPEFGARAQEI